MNDIEIGKDLITKLNQKSEVLTKKLSDIKNENDLNAEVVNRLTSMIREFDQKNLLLQEQFKKENTRKDKLKQKIKDLEIEISNLNNSVITEGNRVSHSQDDVQVLSAEYKELLNNKERLLDKIDDTDTLAKERKTKSNVTSASSIEEVYELLATKMKGQKSSAVLMTSIQEVINIISKNEFSNLKWLVKVSENKTKYGARLRFSNMSTQYSELKSLLRPAVLKLSNKFKVYDLAVKTRIKTSPGEVVEALELTFLVEKGTYSEAQLR